MAQGLSNGCAGLLVFLWVSSTCIAIICATMTRSCSPRSWCKETPGVQPSQKRRWMERKSAKCKGSSTYSPTLRRSGFQKPSPASLSSLLCAPDQWIEIPSGLHAIAVVGHARYGQGASRSCTRHVGTTHGTLAHRIAEGMHWGKSSPGPISKGS